MFDETVTLARREHKLWRDLCTRLFLLKVVTASDLKSRAGEEATAGQRLINQIREWGEARSQLAVAVRKERSEIS